MAQNLLSFWISTKEKQTKHSSLDPLRYIIHDPLMRYVLQHFPVLLSLDPDAGQNVCATVGFLGKCLPNPT